MRIGEYNQLEIHQKAVVLGKCSVFLVCYFNTELRASLYSCRDFYIEVLWDANTNGLVEIIAFKNDQRLDKYLDKIHLADLV